jgi:phage/plasmid-like protein (TIGR03299 family)
MSRETLASLNSNTLIGFTEKRGNAWHYRAAEQGAESNHYPGAIPVEDVRRRLFDFTIDPWDVAISPRLPADADAATRLMREWEQDEEEVAWVRSDTRRPMGYFSPSYQGHQYGEWLLNTMQRLDLPVGSAGLLRRGAVAWVQAELPENVQAGGTGVAFRPNLLNTTSFDGSVKTTFKKTFTVVVCDNTWRMAMGEGGGRGNEFAVSHSKYSLDRLQGAGEALGLLDKAATEFTAYITELTEKAVSDRQWARFLDRWVPTVDARGQALKPAGLTAATKKRDTLAKLWMVDERVSPWKNTAFGVAQAINTFTHHETGVRGDRGERNTMNTILGDTARVDAEAKRLLDEVLLVDA